MVRFQFGVQVEYKCLNMERTRAWRRKKTQSVWKRRLKEHIDLALIPSKEQMTIISQLTGRKLTFPKSWREPKTWVEFKNEVKWARLLRDQGRIQSDMGDKIDAHHKNKLERNNSKKLIDEGINEYENETDDWDDWIPESYDEIFT